MAIIWTQITLDAEGCGKLYAFANKYDISHHQLVTEIISKFLDIDDMKELEKEYEQLHKGIKDN